jgi:hypothetical protein|tara:strand:- start:656 stop:1609 length:954 start_codon:yes stop_codon:yes gene_type:complete
MSNNETMAIANIYSQMLEEKTKKLDPVGKADADIDNDGDVDSSDEFLHARRKAIKKSVKKEAIEVDDEESESEVDDPKSKKKVDKKSTGKQDPAAVNAPSQDDRAAAADAPVVDPTPVLKKDKKDDKEVKEGTEALDENVTKSMGWNSTVKSLQQLTLALKPGSNLHKTVKLSVKGADSEFKKMEMHLAKTASLFNSLKAKINGQNEGFDWDAISEMNEEEVDNYIDTLEESQLDDFESQMNNFISESDDNPRASADEYNKDQQGFKDRHRVNVIDRPDADKPAAADATKASPKRPGDKDVGDKKKATLKRLKDIRK